MTTVIPDNGMLCRSAPDTVRRPNDDDTSYPVRSAITTTAELKFNNILGRIFNAHEQDQPPILAHKILLSGPARSLESLA